jgi:hypothetical protein
MPYGYVEQRAEEQRAIDRLASSVVVLQSEFIKLAREA